MCFIKHHNLDIGPRRLPAQLINRANNAQLFKKRVVQRLKPEQLNKRKTEGHFHKPHTVPNYWEFVNFTYEAPGDLSAEPTGQILREEGTAYEPENLQRKSDLESCNMHVAALVNFWFKRVLIFYWNENDEAANQL